MASKIIINGTTPSKLYIGNSEVRKAYIGNTLIFQKQKGLNPIFQIYGDNVITDEGVIPDAANNPATTYSGIVLTSEGLERLKSGTIISLTYDYAERHAGGREYLCGYNGYGYSSITSGYPVWYNWDKVVLTRGNNEQILVINRSIDNNVKITTTVKYSTNTIEILNDTGEVASTIDISSNPMSFSTTSTIQWGVGWITETPFYGKIYLAESYIQFPDEDKKYYMYE